MHNARYTQLQDVDLHSCTIIKSVVSMVLSNTSMILISVLHRIKVKVKQSRYSPGVAQRVPGN